MSFDLQLAGKRALVTGGGRGVCAAVVQSLVETGVQVMALACTPSARRASKVLPAAVVAAGAKAVYMSIKYLLRGKC